MKLAQILEGPEGPLAQSLAKDLGGKYFAMPGLTKTVGAGKPDGTTEPIRKIGTPRKRRQRKFLRTQAEQPGV